MANYYKREGSDSLNTFQFCTLPMKFELVDAHTFTEVLYPKTIYDLIDYSLHQCIQREQRMRMCKNCGLYFAVKGRGTAEYCDVITDGKGRVCKEVGAFVQWSQSKEDDEIFKVYRREYKKRFARTKTGKITPWRSTPGARAPGRKRRSVRRGRLHWRRIRRGFIIPKPKLYNPANGHFRVYHRYVIAALRKMAATVILMISPQ